MAIGNNSLITQLGKQPCKVNGRYRRSKSRITVSIINQLAKFVFVLRPTAQKHFHCDSGEKCQTSCYRVLHNNMPVPGIGVIKANFIKQSSKKHRFYVVYKCPRP